MERTRTPDEDVSAANREANAPERDGERRRRAETDAAMRPQSGARISQATAGAEISGEAHSSEVGETADAIKRAAENARRV